METKKIIVMGGSFNPPTIAHFKLMEAARRELDIEQGIFVPVSQAYLERKMRKSSGVRICLSEAIRVEMLRMMCENEQGLAISEEEMRVPSRVTTDTMPILQRQYPDAELFFLAGADKLKLITLWAKKRGDFLTQFRVAMVCRDGTDPKQIIDKNPILEPFRDSFQFVTQPEGIEKISSTAIRQAFLENQLHKVKAFLHPAVWDRLRTLTLNDFPQKIEEFRGEYEFLNNSYPCTFRWRHQSWRCAEAAIQAARCADPKEAQTFVNSNAEKAKARASKVKPRADWSAICLELVEEILRAKFDQNAELAQKLHKTRGFILVNGTNKQDCFWGKDLYSDFGKNHLGLLLMKIRDTAKDTRR